MKRELNRTIGLRVKRSREAAGLTQEKLAELIDRSKEAVSNIERGVSLPGLDTIQTICEVTNVPMTSIIDDAGESTSNIDLRARLNATFSNLSDYNKHLIVAIADTMMAHDRHHFLNGFVADTILPRFTIDHITGRGARHACQTRNFIQLHDNPTIKSAFTAEIAAVKLWITHGYHLTAEKCAEQPLF